MVKAKNQGENKEVTLNVNPNKGSRFQINANMEDINEDMSVVDLNESTNEALIEARNKGTMEDNRNGRDFITRHNVANVEQIRAKDQAKASIRPFEGKVDITGPMEHEMAHSTHLI